MICEFAFGYPLVADPYYCPRDSHCLLVCLILCAKNLAWQPSGLGPKICRLHPIWLDRNAGCTPSGWTEMWVVFHLLLVSYHHCLISGQLSQSSLLWLSLGVPLVLEKGISLGMPLWGCLLSPRSFVPLLPGVFTIVSWSLTKIFEKNFYIFVFCVSNSTVRNWPNWKLIFRAGYEFFFFRPSPLS